MNEQLAEQLAQDLANINERAYKESQRVIENYIMRKKLMELEKIQKDATKELSNA